MFKLFNTVTGIEKGGNYGMIQNLKWCTSTANPGFSSGFNIIPYSRRAFQPYSLPPLAPLCYNSEVNVCAISVISTTIRITKYLTVNLHKSSYKP
jgi:hypothetical protein